METTHDVTLTKSEIEALVIALDYYLDPREKIGTRLSEQELEALLDALTQLKDGR